MNLRLISWVVGSGWRVLRKSVRSSEIVFHKISVCFVSKDYIQRQEEGAHVRGR